MILFDFRDPDAVAPWQAIDDRVMGGVSTSRLRAADGHAVFEGTVSGRNNGGFASVRAPVEPPGPAAAVETGRDGWQHLQLHVRGEPLTGFVNLRTDARRDGVSYRCEFETTPDWTTLELPLADFAATFRGRAVRDAPPLDAAAIRQVGLMIAERQFGPFAVALEWIALTT